MSEHPFHVLDVPGAPIGEADLHAYADGQLGDARRAEVAAFLAAHPGADRKSVV